MENQNRCEDCRTTQNLFKYKCPHSYCKDCTIVYVFARLKDFYKTLEENINAYNTTASYLGCKHDCEESRMSLSLRYLYKFLDACPRLNITQKNEFRKFGEVGVSFFSGIKSFFSICNNCHEIISNISEKLLICRECIKAKCTSQTNTPPKGIYYNHQHDETNFLNGSANKTSFYLLRLANNNLVFEEEHDYYRIEKLTELTNKTAVSAIQANVVNETPDYILVSKSGWLQDTNYIANITLIP